MLHPAHWHHRAGLRCIRVRGRYGFADAGCRGYTLAVAGGHNQMATQQPALAEAGALHLTEVE